MKKLSNKKDCITYIASDIEQMHNMYTAQDVRRKWEDTEYDPLTNEAKIVEKYELIAKAGALICGDIEARLSFHLQAGDIVEVKVTNQVRMGRESGFGWTLWEAKVDTFTEAGDKSITLLLYAKNLSTCAQILADYMEQTIIGSYSVKSLKSSDALQIFTDKCPYSDIAKDMERAYSKGDVSFENYTKWSFPALLGEDVEAVRGEKRSFYKISFNCTEVDIDNPDDRETNLKTFIVATYSASRAADLVNRWMENEDAQAKNHLQHILAVEFSKLMTVTGVIPMAFSKELIEDSELEQRLLNNTKF